MAAAAQGRSSSSSSGKPEEPRLPRSTTGDLPTERSAFGDGDVIVVEIKDVRDDLGDDLAALITAERDRGGRASSPAWSSICAATAAARPTARSARSRSFLPGAPLFAMKRRDGTVEIDRAPVPRERDRWAGPVATFVDGTTASAAEMIAGALATYKRGPDGRHTSTFGKGCAQEYVDDDAHAGVLRLTTLVYALAGRNAGAARRARPANPVSVLASAGDGDVERARGEAPALRAAVARSGSPRHPHR